MQISNQRREEIIDSLRRGTVPANGLDSFAVGLGNLESTIDDELRKVKSGQSQFKAIRGEYGCGKTFFSRWLCDRARKMSFATAEVQISETETPLHKLETIYRRLTERMATSDSPRGAMRNLIDAWFYTLEEDVLDEGSIDESDHVRLLNRTNELMESRLKTVSEAAPMFATALRAYRTAQAGNDQATADGVLAWLTGQPNVAAAFKRFAKVKGDIDHDGALNFLQGVLAVLRDSGQAGLVLVLDEVETIQRVRSDVRDKGLNALRQFIDEVDSGRFPGLYLLVTGTTAFYEGPNGIKRLEPLAQRLHVDFQKPEFDNPRAVQVRLPAFDLERLQLVGCKVRDIYTQHNANSGRILEQCPDGYIGKLAQSVAGKLGGKVGVAPRIFLKKLVEGVLDRVDQFENFDPTKDYELTIEETELSDVEREARAADSVDQIELDL